MNLVLKLIFPTYRGGPTGSCGSGGRSGKSGKMRGKWGKIPVRDFYFLSRGFIFNSAGLKRSENELSIKNDFSNPSWRPSGLLRKGEGQRNRESWGKSGPKSPCGISIAKMHHKVSISLFPGRPVRLLR